MGAQRRINGLFSDEARPRPAAASEESGLRPRPTARESLPDLSHQAVELPDEDDLLDDFRPSDTIPPGRLRAAPREDARRDEEPPALPVPLSQKTAPALPLPLTRRSRTSLEELSASVPAASEETGERIDLDEVARLARTSPPPAWDELPAAAPASARRARRRTLARAAGLLVAALTLVGAGFVSARLGTSASEAPPTAPAGTAPPAASGPAATATATPAAPAAAVEAEATEPAELDRLASSEDAPARIGRAGAPAAPVREEPAVGEVERGAHEAPGARVEAPEAEATGAEPEPVAAVSESAPEAEAVDEAPAPELPETPSREQVLEAVRPIEGAVRECAGDDHFGVVPVRITVAPSGRVTTAVVTGGTVLGTPAGSCIARTVRGARFPAFGAERFVVEYPFRL